MIPASQVGSRYSPPLAEWPAATQYTYRSQRHELVLFLYNPTPQEIAGIREEEIALGILPFDDDMLFLLYKIGSTIHWSTAPYSWSHAAEHRQILPAELQQNEDLQIIAVNATTGIIEAVRGVSLASDFATKLYALIVRQAHRMCSRKRYTTLLSAAYARYPTPLAMLKDSLRMAC